jgi:thymidylate synthase (FAD)
VNPNVQNLPADNMIKVLDHGHVRLVDSMGTDLSIARAARVSYHAAGRAGADEKSDERLIRYLWKNKHTTPFEAVTFTFEVVAPIFVFRQWHRHRMWTYNEVSARYTELPELFYTPNPNDVGKQSTTNKQAREVGTLDLTEYDQRRHEVQLLRQHSEHAFTLYRHLIDRGWPRELARTALPLNTYSAMFASVDLHNLFHFLTLRTHPHAQYEIRVYAEALLALVERIVPVAVAAWREGR